MSDTVVPLQLRTSAQTKSVPEEKVAGNPEVTAEVKNAITEFAVATAKGTPQMVLIIMKDHEGKDVIINGGAFDVYHTIGLLEELKAIMLQAKWDVSE